MSALSILAARWAWVPVFQRNLLVWRKLFVPSLIGNIAEPLFVLVAFGFGVGGLIGAVDYNGQAIPYLLFLASGSICASTMTAASFEGLYSAYSRMGPQRTWEGILNAPIGLRDIVLAEAIWAGFKSLFTATAILLVMVVLGISTAPTLLLAWPLMLFIGLVFAAMALVFNALARGYDFFTYYITLFLTPMTFLSGVYFPREQLPPFLWTLSEWLPLTAAVSLVRPLFMGEWPTSVLANLGLLAIYGLGSFFLALRLTERRFGIR
jgi:lipooligosaccharide transport system permease protein